MAAVPECFPPPDNSRAWEWKWAAPANGLSNAATRRPDRICGHRARYNGRRLAVQTALWRRSGSDLRKPGQKKDWPTAPRLLRQAGRVDAFLEMPSSASGAAVTLFARRGFRRV